MKRADMLLIAVVLIAALAFLAPRYFGKDAGEGAGKNLVANITVDGKHYRTVKLTKEEQTIDIRTEKGYNILKVHNYGIEMYEADCPDQVCLGFGFITRPKQTIVCLPHRVLVEIASSTGEDEIDGVVQ
ncbi:NusG domain II-containing protein [Paenibacillus sp. HN-1]|uniref:NusG domain II-containing protein n=1 Tax=Paenibacillus TaxID=44249 RepID=UPI001CA8193B|nr:MULTISPECIES: NusG domain II-containing protein [Paenibacillus]MBY9079983.1 NusG domain II-containing protein [Paenibacillus sp. CGMCC 1.18879]MBY9084625.1 NusG domain II-containing protein [Paenibacillus sinensis]